MSRFWRQWSRGAEEEARFCLRVVCKRRVQTQESLSAQNTHTHTHNTHTHTQEPSRYGVVRMVVRVGVVYTNGEPVQTPQKRKEVQEARWSEREIRHADTQRGM
jgi:hypothetical protein